MGTSGFREGSWIFRENLVARSGGEEAGTAHSAGHSRDLAEAKAALRSELLAARRALTPQQRTEAGHCLRDAVLALPETEMTGTAAVYYSVATEPDTRGLIFALWKRGTYVLLPILRPGGDLDWASYEGPDSLAAGPRGLQEPTETGRGVEAIARADVVLVPALAVDQSGNRLG